MKHTLGLGPVGPCDEERLVKARKTLTVAFNHRERTTRKGHGAVKVIFTTGDAPTGVKAMVQRLQAKAWSKKIDGSRQRGGFSQYMSHAR